MKNIRALIHEMRNTPTQVKQYPFCHAELLHIISKHNQYVNSQEVQELSELETFLSQKSNRSKDNFTVYEITFNDGSIMGVEFADNVVKFGVGIKVLR